MHQILSGCLSSAQNTRKPADTNPWQIPGVENIAAVLTDGQLVMQFENKYIAVENFLKLCLFWNQIGETAKLDT